MAKQLFRLQSCRFKQGKEHTLFVPQHCLQLVR